jgi:hypothetical protein
MMKFFTLALFILTTIITFGQDFSYLDEIKLEKAEDYKKHERTVIEATNFIMKTSTNEKKASRISCSKFIIAYASGVPDITISLSNSVLNVTKKNPEVLVMFMGLFIKTSINHRDASDSFHKNYVFTEIAKYCRQGNGIKNTRVIKSLKKADKKGEMKAWVKDLE